MGHCAPASMQSSISARREAASGLCGLVFWVEAVQSSCCVARVHQDTRQCFIRKPADVEGSSLKEKDVAFVTKVANYGIGILSASFADRSPCHPDHLVNVHRISDVFDFPSSSTSMEVYCGGGAAVLLIILRARLRPLSSMTSCAREIFAFSLPLIASDRYCSSRLLAYLLSV